MLAGKTGALIFEKPSLRTKVSFSVALAHLGAAAITLTGDEIGLGKREPSKDVARVLAGMCDVIVARTFEHQKVKDLAAFSSVPVINALTDYNHPCQAMSDMLTIREHFGRLAGLTMAYIGDGNNMARSLAVACGKFGLRFVRRHAAGVRAADRRHGPHHVAGAGDGFLHHERPRRCCP